MEGTSLTNTKLGQYKIPQHIPVGSISMVAASNTDEKYWQTIMA